MTFAAAALAHLLHHHPNVLSFVLFMALFHAASLFFHLLDVYLPNHPAKRVRAPPTAPTYFSMLPRVLFNQLFLLLPSMLLTARLALSYPSPPPPPPARLPSLLAAVTLAPLLHEAAFYLFHRHVLHSRIGFRLLNHALHHASLAHSAVSAMYMSAPDFLLEIVLPYLLPLVVLSRANLCDRPTCVAMLPLGALGGLYEHSGYNFFDGVPALDTTVHSLHHRFYSCSFADGVGAPSLFDAAFATACDDGPATKLVRSWLGFAPGRTAAKKLADSATGTDEDSASSADADDSRSE